MQDLINTILHFDDHLSAFAQNYGLLVYGLTAGIIFAETGLVFASILPGDSLLFAAGALTAGGIFKLPIYMLWLILVVAAILGDALNYQLGKRFGRKIFTPNSKFLSLHKLQMAEEFYKKHGGKAIILARFVPFARTFAPFVAGVSAMNYADFAKYNVAGGLLWVTSFVGLGYFFGTIPFVQHNFHYLMIGIVLFSIVPVYLELKKTGKKDL